MVAARIHLSDLGRHTGHAVRRARQAMRLEQDDAIMAAYASHLANRVPLIYAILLTNNFILAESFYGIAPDILTRWLPLACVVPLVRRAIYWLPSNAAARSIATLRRDVHQVAVIGPLVAFLSTAWALFLYPYGNPSQQSLVHYIVAITCFATILGLGQSPLASFRVALTSLGPATAWFLSHGHPNADAVCTVQVLVGILLLLVTNAAHRDFVKLERSRQVFEVRERKANEVADRFRDQATFDPLTGILNRRSILADLERRLQDMSHPSPWLAVIDLDGFKQVNDTFGHAAGDAVLKAVCERLSALPEQTTFGRMGGDEFAVLIPGDLPSDVVHDHLTKLIARIAYPVHFGRFQLKVTASVGLRLTQRRSVEECLERADTALYRAKLRPGTVVEFGLADERELGRRQAIARQFASADLESQLSLAFQPIVDFDSGRIGTFETLCRWSPDGEAAIHPSHFIALAEQTGRICELTRLVLQRALADCPVWQHGSRLSINLSAQDLVEENAAALLEAVVKAAHAPPTALVFEVTEAALSFDLRRSAQTLAELKSLGFRVALDDFGIGQSSLACVHRYPLDQLKIDRTFATRIEEDLASQAIASSVLSLARQLGLDCVIEGIETAEQAAVARKLGIRSMQGYYFSRPVPATEALAIAATSSAPPAVSKIV